MYVWTRWKGNPCDNCWKLSLNIYIIKHMWLLDKKSGDQDKTVGWKSGLNIITTQPIERQARSVSVSHMGPYSGGMHDCIIPSLNFQWSDVNPLSCCVTDFLLRRCSKLITGNMQKNKKKKHKSVTMSVRQEVLMWTFCRGHGGSRRGNVRQRYGPLQTGYWGWSRPRRRPSCRQLVEHVVMGAGERDK